MAENHLVIPRYFKTMTHPNRKIMTYADTHNGRSTATVLADNSWLALTVTVLAVILSCNGKPALAANY